MKIFNTGSARWTGGRNDGRGSVSTQSGALAAYPYGVGSRFEGKAGTNPEELLGAAHAACFNMSLSRILGEAKLVADWMETSAKVTLDKQGEGFAITRSDLTLNARIDGIDEEQFARIAADAKANCPVSKVLNAEITLSHTLNA